MSLNPARRRISVQLDPDVRERVRRIAAFEYRSVADYARMLVDRDLHARDEAERCIYVFVAPELKGLPPGLVGHEEGETDERYAARSETLRILFGGQ
jgi:hypothetical protein